MNSDSTIQKMYKIVILAFLTHVNTASNTNCGCGINRGNTKSSKSNFIDLIHDKNGFCKVDADLHLLKAEEIKEEMILIPAGKYQIGTNDVIFEADREGPKKLVNLPSFYLDKYEVSNKEFHKFIKNTKHQTSAEFFGDSFVFSLFLNSTFKEKMKDYRVVQTLWWYKIFGADWRHPYGLDSNITDMMDHPVVHVSWLDAEAYCAWRGARLPTEAEWEAACRGGHRDTKYPWGNKLFPDRKYMANIWQGSFPDFNSAKDGYIGTNPVSLFPPNDFGLYNMAGNVWEWTADGWTKDNPKEKVKKGGSYLCHRSYCYRYRCSARSHNTEDSSAGNLGFRCAKSA